MLCGIVNDHDGGAFAAVGRAQGDWRIKLEEHHRFPVRTSLYGMRGRGLAVELVERVTIFAGPFGPTKRYGGRGLADERIDSVVGFFNSPCISSAKIVLNRFSNAALIASRSAPSGYGLPSAEFSGLFFVP